MVGGLQGWHLMVLLFVVAVVVVIVLVVKAASKPKQPVGIGPNGQPAAPSLYPQHVPPAQIGYTMDGQPIYQQPAQPGTNTFAILALVLGLATGVLGIVFGHIARAQIRQTGESGDGMALAGLIIGYAWLGLIVVAVMGGAF